VKKIAFLHELKAIAEIEKSLERDMKRYNEIHERLIKRINTLFDIAARYIPDE